jgi:hypothetical protein
MHLIVDFPEATVLPLPHAPPKLELSQMLVLVEREGLDDVVFRSTESTMQVVSADGEVVASSAR